MSPEDYGASFKCQTHVNAEVTFISNSPPPHCMGRDGPNPSARWISDRRAGVELTD
jgi:hypothetical protein